MHARYTGRQVLILLAFTLSGFAGLIYESIWSHYLKLFLGHAAYAQSLVLTMFMGGMAFGAWLAARRAIQVRNLLLAYAIVEVLIGALGLAFHPVFVQLLEWAFQTAIPALGSPIGVQFFKWSIGSALILPQSILLGMTFPLISGGLIRLTPARAGEALSLLYFTNCIGAAAGVITSGFFLIERVGLPGTLMAAAALNVLLALVVWSVARQGDQPIYQLPAGQAIEPNPAVVRWLLTAAVATGFASFIYEIAWIRMLTLVLGASTHSFELMLAAFITGLAFGGLWVRRRIDTLKNPVRYLSTVLFLMAILGALTVAAYHYTFDIIGWAVGAFSPTESGYLGFNLVAQTVAAVLMVPVTFCAGITLPVITHALLRYNNGERTIGFVYALNTVGCIVGVLAAVHLLLPAIGLKGAVLFGATIQALLGWTGIRIAADAKRLTREFSGFAAAALVIAGVFVMVHPEAKRMASAVYRHGVVQLPDDAEVLYLRDGKTATISLTRFDDVITIATNGKPDASIRSGRKGPADDEVTMVMAGALPLLLHASPRRVANIGFGSGLTSHTLLMDERVERLDSIEIEPLMVDAARIAYEERVGDVFTDPRSHIVIDDAKTFFSSTQPTYDVIVSEPSNPWVSGVATLFSAEFYHNVRHYLAPGGLLVQWLQIYETDVKVVASVMNALGSNFVDYHIYNVDDSNILIVASNGGQVPDPKPSTFSEALSAELQYVGIMGVEDLTSRRIGNKALLSPFFVATKAPVNSDYFPYVDLNAARFRFMRRDALALAELTTLPMPLQELVNPKWPTLETERPPDRSWGSREELVRRAGLLAYYVSQGQSAQLPDSLAWPGLVIDSSTETCQRAGAREVWVGAVEKIARETSAYLPSTELEPLWARLDRAPCAEVLAGDTRVFFEFLRAVAARDRSGIVANAATLLRDPSVLGANSDRRSYVVTSAAAASIGLGRVGQAASVLRSVQAGDLQGEFGLALEVLYARTGSAQ